MMTWFTGALVAIVVISILMGLLRGAKEQFFKTLSITLAFGVSMGVAIVLQSQTNNFQLLENINGILNPSIVQGIKDTLTPLLPSVGIVEFLNTTLFLQSYSALLAVVVFPLVNKLFDVFFSLIFKLSKLDTLIRKGRDKSGVGSTIGGGLLGLLRGAIIIAIIFAPIVEILAAL